MAEKVEPDTTRETQLINNNTHTQNDSVTHTETELKPWEQHSGVINLPRFDYNAPSSLLNHSHSGFLITCTIKREKSATKEAMSILRKYLESFPSYNNGISVDESPTSKRRKTCTEDLDNEHTNDDKSKDVADKSDNKLGSHANDSALTSSNSSANKETNSNLSLVKLTKSGLLLFTFMRDTSFDVVRAVVDIIQSLESGGSISPKWCHRIFPIKATCILNEMELRATVSKLVLEFVIDKQNTTAQPLKFAVGYKRRGAKETETKIPKDASNTSTTSNLLDQNNCFSIVAAAVKDVVPNSVVDLKSPELSVLVELLPLSGVPNGSLVVAVSVLPQNIVSTKPRLCVKPLVSSVKERGKTH